MNILFLLDPNCIHDIKKVRKILENKTLNVFLITSKHNQKGEESDNIQSLTVEGAIYLGAVYDFSVLRFYRTFIQAIKLWSIIKRYDIERFIIIYAEPNALWNVFKYLFNTIVILFVYGSDVLIAIPSFKSRNTVISRIVFRLYKSSFARFDYVVGTSQSLIESAISLGAKHNKVSVIRTGIDLSISSKSQETFLPQELKRHQFVFFPRNMKPIYNHEHALASISLLDKSILNEYKWVFINSDTEKKDYYHLIKEQASHIKFADILFLTSLSQMAMIACFQNARLTVMTPFSDGSPVSAMEAMACKCPVILPDLAYDRDLFNSDTVFFYKRNEKWSLKNTIENVLSNPNEAELIAQNAFQTVFKNGDINKEMTRFQKIIYRLEE